MKNIYQIGDDLFVIIAFVAFVVAVFARLAGVPPMFLGITPIQLFRGAGMCLLFSIGLSLRDMAAASK